MNYSKYMTITFILNGLYSTCNKVMSSHIGQLPLYTLILFIMASLGAYTTARIQKSTFHKRSALIGVISGTCVVGITLSVINAAAHIQGHVLFPVISGMNLLLVALVGRIIFKEQIGFYGYLGILCGVGAIVMLSI